MDVSKPKELWVKPSLHVYGTLGELTQSAPGGCKVLGSPSDGYYLGNRTNPLTACST